MRDLSIVNCYPNSIRPMQTLEDASNIDIIANTAAMRDGITHEEARAELNRVIASEDFPATMRNRRFLSYVVERALESNGAEVRRVTAHEVATRVFGRPDSFNTLLDPIVRIEAGKLRRDLETYYLKAGRHSRMRLAIPRGGYDPVFLRQEPDAQSRQPALPVTGDLAADAPAELQRLLASNDFPATERNRRFLSYAVEKELAGLPEEITALHVGTRVFGRGENFDPNKDPIVRIEAGKLRRDLETYYLKEGQNNPLRISLPRGGYRPRFSYQPA
jgi:adenylate cyclase